MEEVHGGVRVVARICPASSPTSTFHVHVAAVPGSSSSAAAISFTAAGSSSSSSAAAISSTTAGSSSSSSSAAATQGHVPVFSSVSILSDLRRAHAPRRDEYRVDCCYLKDDPNHLIFVNEVKPLVHHLVGAGKTNASSSCCVITCGQNAAAKDRLFMGSQDNPGLLTMAMEQILQLSTAIGGAVTVSSYQVLQDTHIFDLLEPKNPEILVLEDAEGKTHLKGLSKVDVKSIEGFTQLGYFACNQKKHPTKAKDYGQIHSMGHQGLIIHISRFDQQGRELAVHKMNFLSLAGYSDPKQKINGGGVALSNSNKSFYALMNVVQALNSDQSFVPYRQSKVTRILQDSLCKTSGAVLIACLDDVCCQDTVSTLSLASRSSQVVNEQCRLSTSPRSTSKSNVDSFMNTKNLSREFLSSIHQPNSVVQRQDRPQLNNNAGKAYRTPIAKKRSQPVMHSAKKIGGSFSASIKMKKRDAKPTTNGSTFSCPRTNSSKEDAIVAVPTVMREAKKAESSEGIGIHAPSNDEGFDGTRSGVDIASSEIQTVVSSSVQEDGHSLSGLYEDFSSNDLDETFSSSVPDTLDEKTPMNTTKCSPKLSDRLREISNSLKFLSTRPLSAATHKAGMECVNQINIDETEPKTPVMRLKLERAKDANDTFKARSTGIKKSLVQECLTFLNSANKEQLKSLKGIGEKRANYIIELREESPELFKEMDDLRDIIGMNPKEIKKMMSGILDS